MVFSIRHVLHGYIIILGHNKTYSLGRSRHNNIRLHDGTVDVSHAVIRTTDSYAEIEDKNSKFGTWINNRKICKACKLSNGDALLFGAKHCSYVFFDSPFEVFMHKNISVPTSFNLVQALEDLNIPVVRKYSSNCTHFVLESVSLDTLKEKHILYHLIHRRTVITPEYFFKIGREIGEACVIPNMYKYMPEVDDYLKSKGIEDIKPRIKRKHIFDEIHFIFFDDDCHLDMYDIIIQCGGETELFNSRIFVEVIQNWKKYTYIAVNHTKGKKKCLPLQRFLTNLERRNTKILQISADNIYISILNGALVDVHSEPVNTRLSCLENLRSTSKALTCQQSLNMLVKEQGESDWNNPKSLSPDLDSSSLRVLINDQEIAAYTQQISSLQSGGDGHGYLKNSPVTYDHEENRAYNEFTESVHSNQAVAGSSKEESYSIGERNELDYNELTNIFYGNQKDTVGIQSGNLLDVSDNTDDTIIRYGRKTHGQKRSSYINRVDIEPPSKRLNKDLPSTSKALTYQETINMLVNKLAESDVNNSRSLSLDLDSSFYVIMNYQESAELQISSPRSGANGSLKNSPVTYDSEENRELNEFTESVHSNQAVAGSSREECYSIDERNEFDCNEFTNISHGNHKDTVGIQSGNVSNDSGNTEDTIIRHDRKTHGQKGSSTNRFDIEPSSNRLNTQVSDDDDMDDFLGGWIRKSRPPISRDY